MITKNDLQFIENNNLDKELLEILYNVLSETNPYSLDISKVYSEPNKVLKEKYVETYANSIYYGINKIVSNAIITERYSNRVLLTGNLVKPFNKNNFWAQVISDYFMGFKSFIQKKGLNVGIEYIYNMIMHSGVQFDLSVDKNDDNAKVQIKWGTEENPELPFYLTIEGVIDPLIYDDSVKLISHPVGFGYGYSKVEVSSFRDYVNDYISFEIYVLKIIGPQKYEKDFSDKTVQDISFEEDLDEREQIIIYFDDATKLTKAFDGSIFYQNYYGDIVQQWDGNNFDMIFNYNISLTSKLWDDMAYQGPEMQFFDCLWNRCPEEDGFPVIGKIWVNLFTIMSIGDRVYICNIDPSSTFQLNGYDKVYNIHQLAEFITAAWNLMKLQPIDEEFDCEIVIDMSKFADGYVDEVYPSENKGPYDDVSMLNLPNFIDNVTESNEELGIEGLKDELILDDGKGITPLIDNIDDYSEKLDIWSGDVILRNGLSGHKDDIAPVLDGEGEYWPDDIDPTGLFVAEVIKVRFDSNWILNKYTRQIMIDIPPFDVPRKGCYEWTWTTPDQKEFDTDFYNQRILIKFTPVSVCNNGPRAPDVYFNGAQIYGWSSNSCIWDERIIEYTKFPYHRFSFKICESHFYDYADRWRGFIGKVFNKKKKKKIRIDGGPSSSQGGRLEVYYGYRP